MKKVVISIVLDKDSSKYGKLAIQAKENGVESDIWYPNHARKFDLMKTLLNELTARSEEFKDPLVNRTIADLQIVQQEL
jgi:hypothetical protein